MGFILPGGTATEQLELSLLAERAGWDGVFVWEAAYGIDAWTLLAAIAVRTTRVRLGTLLTPLPWRRPWKVASQVATLDQLSEGRAILTVGLGALAADLPITGEATDLRERADRLDEGIDLIRSLWNGAPVTTDALSRSSSGAPIRSRSPDPCRIASRSGSWGCGLARSRWLACSDVMASCPSTTSERGTPRQTMSETCERGSPSTARGAIST